MSTACGLPTLPWQSLHCHNAKSASSPSFCLMDPATLCVGADLQFASAMLYNTYPEVFWVEHDLSPVIVQHSLTLGVLAPHVHFIRCPNFETDFLREVDCVSAPVTVSVRCHGDRPCVPQRTHPAHSLQKCVVLHHISRNSTLRGVLP